MLKHVRAWALALAMLSLAPISHAACPTLSLTGLTGKDASLNVQTMATLTQSAQQFPMHVVNAYNGSAYAPLTTDTNCNLNVDIQGGSVAVTGAFWPYSLNVDGGVPSHVTNFPSSFGISGTLPAFAVTPNVNLGSAIPAGSNAIGSVSVSNFPATQPVSAAALPLPTGAASAANQTAVQSAPGTSAGAAVTVQGSVSGVALPVSGTVTANAGSGTFAAQDAADAGVAAGAAPSKAQLGAAQYNSTAPTLSTGQTVATQADASGNLKVNCVTGCTAATIASGGVASGAYVLGAIADLGTGGQIHADLLALNTTAGSPGKLQDSGNGDVSDPTNHALTVEAAVGANRLVIAPVSITTTSATTLAAAQGASQYTYITDLDCENEGQYAYKLTITNSGATPIYTMVVSPGGGWVKTFGTPLAGNGQMTANTALTITAAVPTGQTYGGGVTPAITCNVQGRKSAN